MGKTLGISILVVALLIGCSKTTDNHNISVVFYKDGQKNVAQISPDEQLTEEEWTGSNAIYKDKLERWVHVNPDKIITDYGNGEMIVEDGVTGKLMWVCKNQSGQTVKVDYYEHRNNELNKPALKKTKIDNCDFGLLEYDNSDNRPSYSHPDKFTFDFKLGNTKIPPIPEKIRKQYKVDDPFFITFDTLEEGWQKYQDLTKNKIITYGREIEKAFFSSKYNCGIAYMKSESDPQLYRYDNVNPEPDSYWVDRKVGTFKYQRYESKPCKEVPILRSDHFREDVRKYVEKTLRPIWYWTNHTDSCATVSRTIIDASRITMVPLAPKTWMILVASQDGTFDPTIGPIWTFSVVQFDSNKPIIRSWGQETITGNLTWSTYGLTKADESWSDPENSLQLYGVCDVNFDGFKDFIFRFNGLGCATADSHNILIVTYADKGFGEIIPDWYLYDFFGFDQGKPLFQYDYFGCGQLYQSFKDESLASTRWNRHILKVVEPRKDGNLYMVSYKYHTNLEELEQDIKSKHTYYLDLGSYEIIGKAKIAQKAFLETATYTSPEQLEIVKVLLAKNHTMFVDCKEDLLPELKKYNPYP